MKADPQPRELEGKIMGKHGKPRGNHGFIVFYQSNIPSVLKTVNQIWELADLNITSRRLQMQVIFFYVSEY